MEYKISQVLYLYIQKRCISAHKNQMQCFFPTVRLAGIDLPIYYSNLCNIEFTVIHVFSHLILDNELYACHLAYH